MVFGAIDVCAQVQHCGCTTRRIGKLGGNRWPVNAVHGFQHVAGDRHQSAGIASRNGRLSHTFLDLIDGHPHGRVFLAAQGNFNRVVHGDDFAGIHHLAAGIVFEWRVERMRLDGGRLTHKNHGSLGVPFKKGQRCGQRNGRAEIPAHRIDSYADHEKIGAVWDSDFKNRKARINIAGLSVSVANARSSELRFRFCFQHLAATVKASRADVVTQVGFTRGGLDCNAWNVQGIV